MDHMGYHPETQDPEPGKKLSLVRSSLKRAARAYAEDPMRVGFLALLVVIIVLLVLQLKVDWKLWMILAVMAGIRFHEWYRKEGYLSPLLGWLMLKIPQPVNRNHKKEPKKK